MNFNVSKLVYILTLTAFTDVHKTINGVKKVNFFNILRYKNLTTVSAKLDK